MSAEQRADAPFDPAVDATRRTRLANERTYLAWWRTGLTALAVALAVAKVIPEVGHVRRWPYEILGAGFALMGIACIWYGYRRYEAIEEALRTGHFVKMDSRAGLVLTGGGAVLGVFTVVLITVH